MASVPVRRERKKTHTEREGKNEEDERERERIGHLVRVVTQQELARAASRASLLATVLAAVGGEETHSLSGFNITKREGRRERERERGGSPAALCASS